MENLGSSVDCLPLVQPKVGCGLPTFGAPDLRLPDAGIKVSHNRVLAGTQKALDAQVLLDPSFDVAQDRIEEQLDLPAALVQRGNGQGRQHRVVGQCPTWGLGIGCAADARDSRGTRKSR